MIIVSDTTCITNLMHIERLDILKNVFQNIIVPKKVYEELCIIPKQKLILEMENWIICQTIQNTTIYEQIIADLDEKFE